MTVGIKPLSRASVYSDVFRSIFCGGLAAVVSGVVFIGIGSRLLMRAVFLLNLETRGVITDNENIVGAFTADGTFGLVLFFGLLGGITMGAVWVAVRDWLPSGSWSRPFSAAIVATLAGSFFIIESSNVDFALLGPASLVIAMFMGMVALAGLGTTYGDRWLQARLPAGGAVTWMYVLLVALGAFLGVQVVGAGYFISGSFVDDAPHIVGAFIIVALAATVVGWVNQVFPGRLGRWQPEWTRMVGTLGVFGIGLFGAIHLSDQINRIVS